MSNSRISRKDKLIDNIDKAVKHVRMFGAVQLLRNAFFGQFWPPSPLVTKCHTGPNPPAP